MKTVFVQLKNFFVLVRWFHELLAVLPFAGLYGIIVYHAHKKGLALHVSAGDFFLLCIGVQLLLAAGCILNDIVDRDIDRINKPMTHTVGRTISVARAKLLFALISVLIVLSSIYISVYLFEEWAWISAGVYVLSILYDLYFKQSPLLGNILIALLASFVPLVLFFFAKTDIAALHNERITVLIWLYCLFPFFIIIPRELSLDISDMEGDKACGCRTLPIVIGAQKARWVVAGIVVLLIVLSLGVMLHWPYLCWPFAGADALLIVYLVLLKRSVTRLDYIRAGRFLWFVMIAGVLGFTLVTL